MSGCRRLAIGLIAGVAAWGLIVLGSTAHAAQKLYRFDCGPSSSPVMQGYQALTDKDVYSPEKGYGWATGGQESVDFPPLIRPSERGWEGDHIRQNLTDLNRDGVVSVNDLVFLADVPNGSYRVTVTIGDLTQAIGSMDVFVNGKLAAGQVAAWAPGGYRGLIAAPMGWWTYVSHTARVQDGTVRIELKKNQTHYDEQMAEQSKWDNPYQQWRASGQYLEKRPPYYYIGYPFVRNSIMAIEIVPDAPAPVVGADNKLTLSRPTASPALAEAIDSFNRADYEAVLGALERAAEPGAQTARAIVALWLAGRLEVEKEKALVPEALGQLREYVSSHPDDAAVGEILRDAELFQKGLETHLARGGLGKNHFIENDKAVGWLWMVPEGSPLYYKAQLYIARAAHMLVPYIPTLGTEAEILKKLEKKFPDNRHVKYLLHYKWEPYGDGTQPDDWHMVDYRARTEGAPPWARELHDTFATLVDWCEWWIEFKQRPDGSIGGGWGDDVEIVGAFGYIGGFISHGVSDLSIQGTRNLVEGVWNLSEVTPEAGYCLPMADAEHTAEWTGNTLGMMVQIDYGNPLWVERSMKTAKLMRDLWTDYDTSGHRRFRANFFGAAQVGRGDQANDSWINYRAVRPAAAILSYNQNPAIAKLFVELADAWVASAMSTERGKPKGVIPAQVSFPDGLLGGVNSPNWYTASHPQGTVNYDWPPQGYKDYTQDLLLTAYTSTGDARYIEPLRLEFELGQKYGNVATIRARARLGRPEWERKTWDVRDGVILVLEPWQREILEKARGVKEDSAPPATVEAAPKSREPEAEPGGEKWTAQRLQGLEAWLMASRMIEGRKEKLENDITKDDIASHAQYFNRMMKMRWPLMTTEASATDRVAFAGFPNPFFIFTGGRFGGPMLEAPVTYENTTKDFAAAVMASDPQGLRVMYHSFTAEAREVGIVPWELEPGGTYALTYGPDVDEDGVVDAVAATREFVLPQRGTPVRVTVDPRKTYLVEIQQLKRGTMAGLAPDPGLSATDIRYNDRYKLILATVHNIGSKPVRSVKVQAFDGDPSAGGSKIGETVIPNIEAPDDLEPRMVMVAFGWAPSEGTREIYVVIDPEDEIKDEITTFNNVAHKALPEASAAAPVEKPAEVRSFRAGRGR